MARKLPESLDRYIQICQNLKARRYVLDKTQGKIAKELGYRNQNFISMLEKGDTSFPLERTPAIADAYGFKRSQFFKAVLKTRYPEIWELFLEIIEQEPEIVDKSRKRIHEEVEDFINKMTAKTKDQIG